MASSVTSKVGKTIEMSVLISVGIYLVSLAVRVFAIYYSNSTALAGPQFYYWRHSICDSTAATSSYKKISINSVALTDVVETFTNSCQVVNEAKEVAGQPKEFGTNQAGETPLYFIRGSSSFSDSILGSVAKPYMLFGDKLGKMSESDKTALKHEFEFLAFRNVFLTYMVEAGRIKGGWYHKSEGRVADFVPTNFVALKKQQVEEFFKDGVVAVSDVTDATTNTTLKNISKIGAVPINVSLTNEHYEAFVRYRAAYPQFVELFNKLETSTGLVGFDDEKSEIAISNDLLILITNLITALGLKGTFGADQDDVLATNIKGFIRRIATIKPTIDDMRILNRLYYGYLMVNSFYEPTVGTGKEEKYDKLLSDLNKMKDGIDKAIADYAAMTGDESSKKPALDAINARILGLNSHYKKIPIERITIIFNRLSKAIANNLGTKGFVLMKSEDDRNFLDKHVLTSFLLRVHPMIYTEEEKERVEPRALQEVS